MTLIKKKQEPKQNRNYDDWCYPNYDEEVADGLLGKVVQFLAALILIVGIGFIVYWKCK